MTCLNTIGAIALSVLTMLEAFPAQPTVKDSVMLFSYATTIDEGRSGLKYAWSIDGTEWYDICDNSGFLKCDYGPWGAEKRMFSPKLFRDSANMWHCVWQLNGNGKEFAHAASSNLTDWKRQSYFTISQYDEYVNQSWEKLNNRTIILNGSQITGSVAQISNEQINHLLEEMNIRKHKSMLNNEQMQQDSQRFAGLNQVNAKIITSVMPPKDISDKLIGVFFEDINYAADGGLYAELIQNRDFEYSTADNGNWHSSYSWVVNGNGMSFSIDTVNPIHVNNPHYVKLDVSQPGSTLCNSGFDGIVLKKNDLYDFSLFAKADNSNSKIRVNLIGPDGKKIATTDISINNGNWKKYTATVKASCDADSASIEIEPLSNGTYALDMISLFPQKTFKGRKNGLRADLAQIIADLHPRFVRFPGGCVSHGQGIDNIYRWKNSIGPLEARKPMKNIWNYHQSLGIGFFEYFQFCEDIGAEPLPVIAAGVPCQNSACVPGKLLSGGQQGGIPLEEMDDYIQDILDLIEYANGDPTTNKWAKMRADAGHPEPFNLKYIGIGNEDLITDIFEERFAMIYDAIRNKYPDITIIGTVGPFSEGTDYVEGWDLASRLKIPMVDEHYYNTPGWFINNQDFYDKYDRNASKVYLGEYAAHLPGRPNNIETALAEAAYLTSIERNGDVVSMASYAPLLAKEGHTQWNPDLIYFNNKEVKPTVGYYVQMLFGQNSGTKYIDNEVKIDNNREDVSKRIATSIVKDNASGDIIIKLVNLVPVNVNADIDLSTISLPASQDASVTILSGEPDDKHAKPLSSSIHVSGNTFNYDIPSYSLNVIRLKTK